MENKVFTSDIRTVFAIGDLHGDYESFHKILRVHEESGKDSLLLFLGDYSDRGHYGFEIITKLNRLIDSSDNIVALKGNHERYINGKPIFHPCRLIQEAKLKYGSWESFYNDVLSPFISKLHIAAIINNVLFIHAGVSTAIQSRADLEKGENEVTLLWSDPSAIKGEHMDVRGAGVSFGEDVTESVLTSLGLKMIVRSHEPSKAANGPLSEHGGKVITTNACATYGKPWRRFLLKIDTETLEYEPIFIK